MDSSSPPPTPPHESRKEDEDEEEMDETAVLLLDTTHNTSAQDALLEQTVDTCVACINRVDAQHDFEQSLTPLSPTEIRLSAMEQQQQTTTATAASLGLDLNDLNLCGTDDLDDVKTTLQHHLHNTSTTHQTKSTSASHSSSLQCAICFEDVASFQHTATTFCYLPCCGSDGKEARSSTKVCTACMLLLSQPTSQNSKIGQCPRCRAWLLVKQDGLDISVVKSAGTCNICNQVKETLLEEKICDACFLGKTHPLYYECQQCRQFQCIPHPMYRYQATPQDYGTTSWACQGRCQNFTRWKLVPEYIPHIPAGDVPESWGEDSLERARIQVMELRRRNATGDGSSACAIQ